MKTMIIAAAVAGMLGFAAHGQAVPSHETGHGPTTNHCWVKPVAMVELPAHRSAIEPVYLTAIC